MPKSSRKSYSPEIKAKIALEAIIYSTVGGKSMKQIAEEYDVHQTQVNLWKNQALESIVEKFKRSSKTKDSSDDNSLIDDKSIQSKLDKMLKIEDTDVSSA